MRARGIYHLRLLLLVRHFNFDGFSAVVTVSFYNQIIPCQIVSILREHAVKTSQFCIIQPPWIVNCNKCLFRTSWTLNRNFSQIRLFNCCGPEYLWFSCSITLAFNVWLWLLTHKYTLLVVQIFHKDQSICVPWWNCLNDYYRLFQLLLDRVSLTFYFL